MTASKSLSLALLGLMATGVALADAYEDTRQVFREAMESAEFFDTAYAYAVFPTIGRAGFGIGGALGRGRVYRGGEHVGDTRMTQLTIGFQLGGQAYSQIIFMEDERAFREFTAGNFEFGAQASAVAITASAQAMTGTTGTSAGVGTSQQDAQLRGGYQRGMAVYTLAKGGLMYEASIGGQTFSYVPR
jgi:lipid-binding SYLF domain-containing protein